MIAFGFDFFFVWSTPLPDLPGLVLSIGVDRGGGVVGAMVPVTVARNYPLLTNGELAVIDCGYYCICSGASVHDEISPLVLAVRLIIQ